MVLHYSLYTSKAAKFGVEEKVAGPAIGGATQIVKEFVRPPIAETVPTHQHTNIPR